MPTASLWAEVAISGLFLFAAVFFLILSCLKVYSLNFLSAIRDYQTLVSVCVIIISYILGILAHRLILIVLMPAARTILTGLGAARLLSIPEFRQSHSRLVAVWQHGSERLQKELDYQFNFLTLFTSLTVILPILGASVGVWLAGTTEGALAVPVAIAGLVCGLVLFGVQRQQARHYHDLQIEAVDEIGKGLAAKPSD